MKNLDNNQTLRELRQARKQTRPNKQNTDSGDTDSYENIAKFKNLTNSNSKILNNQNQSDDGKDPHHQRLQAAGAFNRYFFNDFGFYCVVYCKSRKNKCFYDYVAYTSNSLYY